MESRLAITIIVWRKNESYIIGLQEIQIEP